MTASHPIVAGKSDQRRCPLLRSSRFNVFLFPLSGTDWPALQRTRPSGKAGGVMAWRHCTLVFPTPSPIVYPRLGSLTIWIRWRR